MAEIRKRNKDEWVLIEYTKLDEELNTVGDGLPPPLRYHNPSQAWHHRKVANGKFDIRRSGSSMNRASRPD
jgi:hypothetical protein